MNQQFDIDCDVTDGNSPPVAATTLRVTCSDILFFDDMESGEGDWIKTHAGPDNGWSIVSGGHTHWWHSNGGNNTSTAGADCSKLFTPQITIPTGISQLKLEIYHRATGMYYSNTVYNGPALLISRNNGASVEKVIFPVLSGPQYTNWAYPYTSTYHFGVAYGCTPSIDCWGLPAWTDVTSPTTSVVDMSSIIPPTTPQTIRIGFIYGQGLWYTGDLTWGVDDVKVTGAL